MKNFKLTAYGRQYKNIHLPMNPATGDPFMRIDFSNLSDADAQALWDRKDGKGKKYLTEVPAQKVSKGKNDKD